MTSEIETLRQKFNETYAKNLDEFCEQEYQLVNTDDWWLRRYLHASKNVDSAFDMLMAASKWRKSVDIFNLKNENFPSELFQINLITKVGHDLEGNKVLWFWSKRYKKIDEIKESLKTLVAKKIHDLFVECKNDQCVFVIDFSECGLSNIDISFSFFIIKLIQSYYPCFIKKILNVDLPWILNANIKIIMTMMSQDLKNLVHFIKSSQLVDYISKENIPKHLNGSLEINIEIPPNCKPMKDWGFNNQQIQKVFTAYNFKQQFG